MKTVIYVIGQDGPKMGHKNYTGLEIRTGDLIATLEVPFSAEHSCLADLSHNHAGDVPVPTCPGFFRGDKLVFKDDNGELFYALSAEEILKEVEMDDGFDYGAVPSLLAAIPGDCLCAIARLKD